MSWKESANEFIEGVKVLAGLGLFIWLVFWTPPWLSDTNLFTKVQYALQYGFRLDAITVEKKPHDCEYSTAPLGAKHCHYDAVVVSSSQRQRDGQRFICSYDQKKTWTTDCWDSPDHLQIRWDRVED